MQKNFYYLLLSCFGLYFMSCSGDSSSTTSEEATTATAEPTLESAQALAQKIILVDGHVDLPTRLRVNMFRFERVLQDVSQRSEGGNFDYERSKEGGLDAPFMSIYIPSGYQKEEGRPKIYADSLIDMVEGIAVKYPEKFAMAYSPADIEANFKKGLISLPMGMENGAPIGDDISNVEYFYKRGIRYITLTHGKVNLISDSSYDTIRTWNGLSPFGEEVVKEMNRVGIMVDISHVSDSAFYDVMAITKAPAIASHSSVRKFVPGFERNMNDDMITKLAKNGGVIMINFGSTFVDIKSQEKRSAMRKHFADYAEENNLEWEDSVMVAYRENYVKENPFYATVGKVADHIDHVKNLVGIDHVGLGSDYDGVGDSLPTGLKDVSEYPNLILELLKRGYTEEEIEKICYKNIFRVWNEVEKVASDMQAAS